MSSEMALALEQLKESERGVRTIAAILQWLNEDGIGLDEANKLATIVMIKAAWKFPDSGRDMMQEACKIIPDRN